MKVHLIAQVLTISCSLTLSAADWPQWRGPQRDGLASGLKVALPKDASQMLLKWKIPIGTGFSSPIVTGGRVYILDDQDGHETAHCLDAVSGKEIWRKEYAVTFGDEWGRDLDPLHSLTAIAFIYNRAEANFNASMRRLGTRFGA